MFRFLHSKMLVFSTAAVLLALIAVDLGDASCDPLPAPSETLMLTGPQEEGAEACEKGCIPDCFCCSRPLPAAEGLPLEGPRIVTGSIFIHPPRLPADFSDVIDHVPLAIL